MKTLFLILGVLATAWNAQANEAPAMFTDCASQVKVKAPKNSSGYYFSESCKTIYVLPPQRGGIEISRPTRTMNTSYCSLANELAESNQYYENKVSNLRKRAEKLQRKRSSNNSLDPWSFDYDEADDDMGDIIEDDPIEEELDRINAKIRKIVKQLIQDSVELSEVEGPKMTMAVSADQAQLVEEFKRKNPRLNVRAMPIAKGVLSFINNSSNTGKAKAALSWGVAGLDVSSGFFTGLKADDLAAAKNPMNSHVLFNGAVTGQVVLSLVGACPFVNEEGHMPEVIEARDMAGHLATSVDYIYNVKVNRAYKASYQLAELFRRIQKQSKRGGFFSSKTIHSIVTNQKSEGWFKFESLSEDPRQEWDENLAQTVKAQIIARALKQIGAVPVGKAEDVPGMIPPGEQGSAVISRGLKKCPHVYCQAAGFVLDGLGAVFGRSTAVSKFIATNDRWQSEEVRESKMVPQMSQVMIMEN